MSFVAPCHSHVSWNWTDTSWIVGKCCIWYSITAEDGGLILASEREHCTPIARGAMIHMLAKVSISFDSSDETSDWPCRLQWGWLLLPRCPSKVEVPCDIVTHLILLLMDLALLCSLLGKAQRFLKHCVLGLIALSNLLHLGYFVPPYIHRGHVLTLQ